MKHKIVLTLMLSIVIVSFVAAQSNTVEMTEEAQQETQRIRTYEVEPFHFDYLLDFYSLHLDCGEPVGDAILAGVGLIEIIPNDGVIYDSNVPPLPYITISATQIEANSELDETLLGLGPIIQYVNDAIRPETFQQIDLNGVPAFRVDDLPIGQAGVSTHIVAIHEGLRYDIIVEPRSGTSALYDEHVEQFLESFQF